MSERPHFYIRNYADHIERYSRAFGVRDLIRAVVCVACCALIGAMLAQGV